MGTPKNVKGILFEKRLCTSCTSNQCDIVQDFYHIQYILQRGKLVLRSPHSVGLLLLGFANTCDILSLVSEVRYFQGVVTFTTLWYEN